MGDRGNVGVVYKKDQPPAVWVYSHWGGYKLPEVVCGTVSRSGRLNDPSYFMAELVHDLIKSGLLSGIGPAPEDNEYPFVIVDLPAGVIRFANDDRMGFEYARKTGKMPIRFDDAQECSFTWDEEVKDAEEA